MRPPEAIPGSPSEWLRFARSDLALARAARPDGVMWENLCFHIQQAAEKAIKSVLLSRGEGFRYVHDVDEHLSRIAALGVPIPEAVKRAVELNPYAFVARYPLNQEPVAEEEYREALGIAETVIEWAASVVEDPTAAPEGGNHGRAT